MEKNRSIKELLQLLLDFGNKNFLKEDSLGLCYLSKELGFNELITPSEYVKLMEFLLNNRPQPDSPHFDKSKENSDYWWPVGVWAPRKRWLIDQIKSL